MTRSTRRPLGLAVLLVVLGVVGWSAWLALQVRAELVAAQSAVDRLQQHLTDDDTTERDRAVSDLTESATSARDLTDGGWWTAMTWLPIAGDDAAAVRGLSSSLAEVSVDGLPPLLEVADQLPQVQKKGRIDLETVARLEQPVAQGSAAFDRAVADVSGVDSSDLAGAVRGRFDGYVKELRAAAGALADAERTVELLPPVLGADGPRDYLLVFQNNAEVRGTGGLPGSWARVHAEDGDLSITSQGSARDFPVTQAPVPLSREEIAVYNRQLGTFWLDANFTPDFPRAAELFSAHWDRRFPDQPIDGVISLDTVSLSYLLEGTGPISVGDVTLTPEAAVDQLLSEAYVGTTPEQQDLFFAAVSKAVFDQATAKVGDPLALVGALRRSAAEGRLLLALEDDAVMEALGDSRVLGQVRGDDDETPHVDISLNDLTGSKMSYYLRSSAELDARSCEDGVQRLGGRFVLRQSIDPAVARELPDYVTGGGNFGTEPGSQTVFVRFHAPYDGTVEWVKLDGKNLYFKKVSIEGRPVATFVALLSSVEPAVFTYEMTTGPGQTGDIELGVTPGVTPGDNDAVVDNAC
ncbi:DUF4012 domain-containing protein [Nocardioides aestuarii]|uniref:DUF4012 domain-containing protein n=1 Tax=Nocardioides aestuarii TaxID=252231 RepID=A0ABW4TKN3_9ACTN